jgi:hypothetical protein
MAEKNIQIKNSLLKLLKCSIVVDRKIYDSLWDGSMVFNFIGGHSRYIDNGVKLRLSDNRTKTMNPSYPYS